MPTECLIPFCIALAAVHELLLQHLSIDFDTLSFAAFSMLTVCHFDFALCLQLTVCLTTIVLTPCIAFAADSMLSNWHPDFALPLQLTVFWMTVVLIAHVQPDLLQAHSVLQQVSSLAVYCLRLMSHSGTQQELLQDTIDTHVLQTDCPP